MSSALQQMSFSYRELGLGEIWKKRRKRKREQRMFRGARETTVKKERELFVAEMDYVC